MISVPWLEFEDVAVDLAVASGFGLAGDGEAGFAGVGCVATAGCFTGAGVTASVAGCGSAGFAGAVGEDVDMEGEVGETVDSFCGEGGAAGDGDG